MTALEANLISLNLNQIYTSIKAMATITATTASRLISELVVAEMLSDVTVLSSIPKFSTSLSVRACLSSTLRSLVFIITLLPPTTFCMEIFASPVTSITTGSTSASSSSRV